MLRWHCAHRTGVFQFLKVIGANQNECSKAKAEELVDISQQVHSTNCKHIKEQCLDLKPYKDGREVLLDLSKDAEIVQQNATERKTDSEAMRIAKAVKYCTLGPPQYGKKLVSLDISN